MLKRLVETSLRWRGAVLALACVLLLHGVFVAAAAKLDVFPEFVQPQVTVQTEAPGLAPEQVETLVTRTIEGVCTGVGNLESIRSQSIQGLSVVTAVFKEGTDIYLARQMLSEQLTHLAGALPGGVKPPNMSPLTSSTMDLLKVGFTSGKLSPMALRTFVEWTVRPRLLSVPGVAAVKVFGGEVRQLQIQIQPERLLAFGISVQEVADAARAATGVRGAGFVETAQQRLVLKSEGQALDAAQLGEVVVTQHEGRGVRLRDVARVVEAAEPMFGSALVNGEPGILLTMSGQFGANTMQVTEAVEAALADLRPGFEAAGVEYVPHVHRPATFIEHAIQNVKISLLLGAAFVGVILLCFLLDWRTAFISFTAIPLSLLAAIIVLDRFGVTLNTMTLGGLAVAIGVVVDDAIIGVENVLRRLRENLTRATPRALFDVVLDASLEVRGAVVYASFIVALVFLPVLTMSGLQGKFFAPLGVAFILANLASLLVALTVTPALCMVVLSRRKPRGEPRYLLWLKGIQRRALELLSKRPKAVIGAAVILFAGALATLPFFGGELLPPFREGHFVAHIAAAPGTSLGEMLRIGGRLSHELLEIPELESVGLQVGRAELGEDTWGVHKAEFHIELKPAATAEQARVQEAIRAVLDACPGLQSEVLTFLGDRIGESISGETAQVVVSVFGDDLELLDTKAREVAQVLHKVRGAADVQLASSMGAPSVVVKLRAERLTQFGFRPVEVLEAVQTAYQGDIVAQAYEGNRVCNVSLILEPAARQEPESIGTLLVGNAAGTRIPLNQLAEVYATTGREMILHDGARRRQTVTCNPRGRDVTSFVAEAKASIAAQVIFPAGVYPEFSGAAEQQAKAQNELLLHSAIAGAGIVLLLAMVFRNGRNLMLVLANVPFALVGGILASFFAGCFGEDGHPSLSLGTLVGLVTLFGITMRNSIMIISHFEHLVNEEGMIWGPEAAMRGAVERLIPILMTATVTGLGLLPLALGSGEAGREIEGPMAMVILGGLFTSTTLNLFLLPTLALRYGRFGAHSAQR